MNEGPSRAAPPKGGRILLGPLLTVAQVARRLDAPGRWVARQPYLLRIEGPLSVGAALPAFQLDGDRLRQDVCFVALFVRRRVTDLEACDWMVRPLPALGRASPLAWLGRGGRISTLFDLLPEATRPGPTGERRVDVDEARRTWLAMGDAAETPGWRAAWERISAPGEAYPAGI